jgi:hypothetical protein
MKNRRTGDLETGEWENGRSGESPNRHQDQGNADREDVD